MLWHSWRCVENNEPAREQMKKRKTAITVETLQGAFYRKIGTFCIPTTDAESHRLWLIHERIIGKTNLRRKNLPNESWTVHVNENVSRFSFFSPSYRVNFFIVCGTVSNVVKTYSLTRDSLTIFSPINTTNIVVVACLERILLARFLLWLY